MRFSASAALGGILLSTAALCGGPIEVRPGDAAAYEGFVEVKQSVGEDASNTGKFLATLACRVSESAPGKLQVYAVRYLKPTEEGPEPLVSFDDGALAVKDAGFKLDWRVEIPPELEENSAALEALYPLVVLPEISAPESGGEVKADGELAVLGSLIVKAPIVASLRRDGESVTFSRKLAPGATPDFKFRDEASTLVSWSETFRFASSKGLPTRIERTLAFEGKIADTKSKFELTLTLDRKKQSDGSGEDGARLDATEKDLRSLGVDFAALKSPEEISKRVAAALEKLKGTLWDSARDALSQRLVAYKASGLGKTAPDFTLESLDGKQVAFRDATKGKVVLLSFWGVG